MTAEGKKTQVFVVSSDKTFSRNLAAALGGEGCEVTIKETAREVAVTLGTEEVPVIIADLANMPAADRDGLLQIHRDRGGFSFFLLDTIDTLTPKEESPLRRLSWPLPVGLVDAVRAVENPVVFLADQALFGARALQLLLPSSGVQPMVMDNHMGVVDHLQAIAQAAPEASPPPTPRKRSLWDKFKGDDESATADSGPAVQRVIVAQFTGSLVQAEAFDGQVRKAIPDARCYFVSAADPMRIAVKAVQEGQPVRLMREQAPQIASILKASAKDTGSKPVLKEKETVVLLDTEKEVQDVLAQALLNEGYQVQVAKDGAHIERMVGSKGSIHLVVIGTAIAYAKGTGKELATKLRELDEDVRIIFMVDKFPIESVVDRLSEVVRIGVDDTLIKPVEPVLLLQAADKALQRRRDIFEIKRLNKELGDTNSQLAQINSFQTKFFHMVAHDVKNPLTAILGYCEVIAAKFKDQADALKYTTHIHSAAKTLNLLISDLVDLAAIESGKLRVDMAAVDLGAVVKEVRSRIEVVAKQRQIAFGVLLPPQMPPLQGDHHRLGQVIQNLCTNAIQYTKEGGKVGIRVDVVPDWVTVSVQDTGIGIAKEDIPRVWQRFFQTAEAQKMRKAGFGLGLKIAREIVQRHGGEMGIESQLGVGSRFFFTLPLPKQQ